MPTLLRLLCCAGLILATAAAPSATPPTRTPASRSDPAAPAERILVVGDSQAQGLSIGLEWLLRANRAYHVVDRSKISSGLVNLNFYDWPEKVKPLAADERADVAIVMFGANDRPPVRRNGRQDPRLLANFVATYGARVQAMIATLQAAHVPVIWVGHPIVRDPVFSEDLATLNAIYADQATRAGATFLPLWTVFANATGGYDADGIGPDGSHTRLRADDGVHMTAAGYEDVGKLLIPLIDAHRARSGQGLAAAAAGVPVPRMPAGLAAPPTLPVPGHPPAPQPVEPPATPQHPVGGRLPDR